MKIKGFIGDVFETYLTRIFLIALGVITTIIVTRLLGPAGRGSYALAIAIASIATQIGTLGMHSANTYYVSKNYEDIYYLTGNSILISILISIVISVTLSFAFVLGFFPSNDYFFLLLICFAIFLNIHLALSQGILTGSCKIREYNRSELILKISALGYILIVYFISSVELYSALGAVVFSLFISMAFTYKKIFESLNKPIRLSKYLFWSTFRYGLKVNLSSVFIVLIIKSNIFILKKYVSLEEIGFFSLALNISDVIYTLPVSIGIIFFPKLTSINSYKEKLIFFSKTIKSVAVLMSIVNLAVIYISEKVILVFFGHKFYPAAGLLIGMMPFNLIFSINTLYMQYFASCGMPNVTIYAPFVAFLVSTTLNLLFIPKWGSVGAVLSLFFSSIVLLLFSWNFIRMENENV